MNTSQPPAHDQRADLRDDPRGDSRVLTPVQRLNLSRAQISAVLQQRHAPPPASASAWRQAAPAAAALFDGLKAIPGVGVVADALAHWWAQHPLRSVVVLADGALQAVVTPLARRHPYTLAAGALLVGALLAWSRPWRLARRHGLLNGLGPALVAVAMARMPLQAWFTGVLAKLLQQLPVGVPAQEQAAGATPAPEQPPAPLAGQQQRTATGTEKPGAAAPGGAPATPFPTSANHPPQPGEGLGAPPH